MSEPAFEAQTRRGFYTLTRCTHDAGPVSIPARINGHRVEAINAGVFLNDKTLTAVHMPDTVVRIDDSAFQGCSALQSVRLPQSLNYLGSFAFADCDALESIDLPDSLQFISYGCFSTCTALSRVTLPKALHAIGNRAFDECRSLEQIDFPETLTEIGNMAFFNCLSLKTPVFPEGLTAVGNDAFVRSAALSSAYDTVVLPKSLELLGARAFRCRRLIISGDTETDYFGPGIEIIVAPQLTPGSLHNVQAQYAACVGYAELLEADTPPENEIAGAYEEYLIEAAAYLPRFAVHHPPLMRLLIRRALIDRDAVPALIEACSGNTELCAELIAYAQRNRSEPFNFENLSD